MAEIINEQDIEYEDEADKDENIIDENADDKMDGDEQDPISHKDQIERNLKAAGVNIEEVDE